MGKRNTGARGVTIGLDLGDKSSQGVVVDARGEVVERMRIRTAQKGLDRAFAGREGAQLVLEVGLLMEGAEAATRRPCGYDLWYHSGGGRLRPSAGGQRCWAQLSAQLSGDYRTMKVSALLLASLALACSVFQLPSAARADSEDANPSGASGSLRKEIREQLFSVTPSDLGISRSASLPHVWGIVMEWVQSDAVVSLVSFAEGSTSIYFSTGGGIIGGGQHESVRNASRAFLGAAEALLPLTRPAESHPPPPVGTTRFYIFTYSGLRVAQGPDSSVRERTHQLFPLFAGGQQVITEFRKAEQKR